MSLFKIFSNFLSEDTMLSIEVIEYAKFQNIYFEMITVSLHVRIVNVFCLSCDLSSFEHTRVFGCYVMFLGQWGHGTPPPKFEGARTPMAWRISIKILSCLRTRESVKLNCWKQALAGSPMWASEWHNQLHFSKSTKMKGLGGLESLWNEYCNDYIASGDFRFPSLIPSQRRFICVTLFLY